MAGDSQVKPPWIQYPGNDTLWGGWRQGVSEEWLLNTWRPFWLSLSRDERDSYLQRWPPPDEQWRAYVTTGWD